MSRYLFCGQGHRHFGPHGAAGLLVRHSSPSGSRYLMQRRSSRVQHPWTWSTPGGALRLGESPRRGAAREAAEELGPLPPLRHSLTYEDAHGRWTYHTVVMEAEEQFQPGPGDGEGFLHRWCTPEEIQTLALHPDFAASWPRVRAALRAQETRP